ncbi:MAG: hypothetical protein GOV02_00805 [Candidatus Aenigmarchaeota archaeon]|nr:hypothetical protein [Candidatus Aenigmarchaeota archaeon]
MKRFFLALLIGGLLLPCLVVAQTTTLVGIDIQEPDFYPAGQNSIANLTITNNDIDAWFTISIIGVPSSWLTAESSIVKVNQGETRTIALYGNIPAGAEPAYYGYDFTVTRSGDGFKMQEQVVVNVVQNVEAIITELDTSCFQCDTDITVSGTIKNIGTQPVPLVVNIAFGSEFKMIDMGTLDVSGEKKFIESFDFSDHEPGEFELIVDLMTDDRKVFSSTESFNIITEKNVSYIDKVTITPIGRFVAMQATNYGNAADGALFTSDRNSEWWAYFMGEEPDSITDTQYSWAASLAPEESATVTYYEIYWPVIVLVLIIILVGIYYYLQFTTISLRKTVRGTHRTIKGHDIPVALIVKNNKIAMDSVVIRDIVPHGFSVTGKFDTLKPIIRKISDGTELVWRIGKLRTGEERVLHYKMKPSKEIHGDVDLPLAAVRAKHDDKSIVKHSNVVELHGKITEQTKHTVKVE